MLSNIAPKQKLKGIRGKSDAHLPVGVMAYRFSLLQKRKSILDCQIKFIWLEHFLYICIRIQDMLQHPMASEHLMIHCMIKHVM